MYRFWSGASSGAVPVLAMPWFWFFTGFLRYCAGSDGVLVWRCTYSGAVPIKSPGCDRTVPNSLPAQSVAVL